MQEFCPIEAIKIVKIKSPDNAIGAFKNKQSTTGIKRQND